MNSLLYIILALWLLPAVLCYILSGVFYNDWRIRKRDAIMLIPLLNIVILLLVVFSVVDDFILDYKMRKHYEEF